MLAVPVIRIKAGVLGLLTAASFGLGQVSNEGTFFPRAVGQENWTQAGAPARQTPPLRNAVLEKLAEAQDFAEKKDYAAAMRVLDDMLAEDAEINPNSYETANIYNLYAWLIYAQGNYEGALTYYHKLIAQPDIPLEMETDTRYTMAKLYFALKEWEQGIDAMLIGLDLSETPNASNYVLLAQGYYKIKNYDLALQNVEIAISMREDEGQIPAEGWYNFARHLYVKNADYISLERVLNELVIHYPKDQYRIDLDNILNGQMN